MNPFFLKFTSGNIRVCQGCRQSLRDDNGIIPPEPYNLCVGRFEKREWRDKSGKLNCPQRESCAHYHPRLECIAAVEPSFVGQSLVIPDDVLQGLSDVHKMYMLHTFNINIL